MSLPGINYAEQAEVYMPTIYDLYREDFENAGIQAIKAEKTDKLKDLLQTKTKVSSPLYALLFDYNDENFEWYKPVTIVNRLSRLVTDKDDAALNKKYNVINTEYFTLERAINRSKITLDDVMYDKVPLKENDELLKDIAFMPLSTMNRLPAKTSQDNLLDLLRLRVDLTTWRPIKKRQLFSQKFQLGTHKDISQSFIPNRSLSHY